ncbi:uncharacterized protein VTP21DRAFT_6748 [Calcarisporiella thermophila]|uniref:uncharacterized protein n=1 Tax=Calcarisporiella thermophila TaxID=911321 RepID=UPI0037442103
MKLRLTEKIRSAARIAVTISQEKTEELDLILDEQNDIHFITLELLQHISKTLISSERESGEDIGSSKFWLHKLLEGTSIYIPPVSPREKSPELLQRLEEIRTDLANKEYARMVGNPNLAGQSTIPLDSTTYQEELREATRITTGIFNILFSVAAVCTAIFYASRTVTDDPGMRVLLALSGGIVIASAESFLYYRYYENTNKPPAINKSTQHTYVKSKTL